MIQEYQIINSAILFELVAAVNREIEEGWQPIGGIAIVTQKVNSKNEIVEDGRNTPIFYQAMVKQKVE